MAVWEAATVQSPGADGSVRVDVGAGSDWVKFLSESFRENDGADYGWLGVGIDVIKADA